MSSAVPPAATMTLKIELLSGRDCISTHFRALLAMAIQPPPQLVEHGSTKGKDRSIPTQA
jgi:hypothetical protein